MRLVQNLFVPTPPRPKQKGKLINKIVELNVRATPPSRWRSISIRGKLGSETIPLSMEQQYFWAKEAGKLNKTILEKKLERSGLTICLMASKVLFSVMPLLKTDRLPNSFCWLSFPS